MPIIDNIVDDYGMFDGAQLNELVCREDQWRDAAPGEEISRESIKNYYGDVMGKHL
jgi:uncharacterized phage-associated protein